MMRNIKRMLLPVFLCFFVCGCGRTEENVMVIGREENKAGSVSLSALEAVSEPEENAALNAESELRVYVCGAVKKPGVVALQAGARVEDALKAVGGFAEDADRNAVNLADWVSDGERIYFLTLEEAAEQEAEIAEAAGGLVNINTADAATLCTLPGIGEARAQDIITYRTQSGGFESTEDIMKVPGIKTSVFEKIRDKITVK